MVVDPTFPIYRVVPERVATFDVPLVYVNAPVELDVAAVNVYVPPLKYVCGDATENVMDGVALEMIRDAFAVLLK